MKMPYDDGCPICEAPLKSRAGMAGKIHTSWLACTKCQWSQRFEATAVASQQISRVTPTYCSNSPIRRSQRLTSQTRSSEAT